MKSGQIRTMFIFEIMGRPAEYIVQAMDIFIEKLGSIEGVEIVGKKVHTPKAIEDGKGFFTTFAEVEIVLDRLELLFTVMFHMFPSHVEILEPEEFRLSNFELGSIASDLAVKLHKYEEVTKGLTGEREMLLKRLKEVDPGFFKQTGMQSVQEVRKEKEETSKKTKKKSSKKKKI
jgi:hypothetical protein